MSITPLLAVEKLVLLLFFLEGERRRGGVEGKGERENLKLKLKRWTPDSISQRTLSQLRTQSHNPQ